MEQVWKTIEQSHMFEPGDGVLLGVSGGPDSMALLDILDGKKEDYGIHLYVVHVNHKLRVEAEEEAAYVERICKERSIPFKLFEVDVTAYAKKYHMSFEQAGHEVRFESFRKAGKEWKIDKIALGHHKDDKVETVLMHLIQGAGLEGLAAMPRKEGKLVRPLLETSKQELIAYCEEKGLKYYTDQTNLEEDCLRNRIRLNLLPELEAYNPNIREGILRMEESVSADLDHLEEETEKLMAAYGKTEEGEVSFPIETLKELSLSLKRRVLRRMYRILTGTERNLTFKHTEDMRKLALSEKEGRRLSLPGKVVFTRNYGLVTMRKEGALPSDYQYLWDLKEDLLILGLGRMHAEKISEKAEEFQDLYTVFLDTEKITLPLTIRTRKPGDRLEPVGMQGHKSLKKFMIDKKIPKEYRNAIPLVLTDEDIIWIPGCFFGKRAKVTEQTKAYYRLQWIPGNEK